LGVETGDEGDTETAGEEGVLAIGFLTTSPAGITKDVDVGGPEGEAVKPAGVAVELRVVIFAASFGGDDVSNAMQEVGVPSGGQADSLRENGGDAGIGDAVEALIPPVVGGNVEARYRCGNILHLGDFFLEGKAGDEVVDALIQGERRVKVRRSGLSQSCQWNND
jgi:hypothetical protein